MIHQGVVVPADDDGNVSDAAVYHAGQDEVHQAVTSGKGDGGHQALGYQLGYQRVIAVGENDSQGIGIGAYHISSPPFTFSLIMALGPIFAWSPI